MRVLSVQVWTGKDDTKTLIYKDIKDNSGEKKLKKVTKK